MFFADFILTTLIQTTQVWSNLSAYLQRLQQGSRVGTMGPIYPFIIDSMIAGCLLSKLIPKSGRPKSWKTNRGKCYFCGRTRKKHKARDFACRNHARSIQTSRLPPAASSKAPQYVQVPDCENNKIKLFLSVLTILTFLIDPVTTEKSEEQQERPEKTPEKKVFNCNTKY